MEAEAGISPFGKRELAEFVGQNSARLSKPPCDIYKTGSLNAGGNSLTVSGTINGRTCIITVDTGSNISIVRPDVLNTHTVVDLGFEKGGFKVGEAYLLRSVPLR